MIALLQLFLPLAMLPYFVAQNDECITSCSLTYMGEGIVPHVYNECSCQIIQEAATAFHIPTRCTPYYRSLKFRNKSTGEVLLHKAVVRVCVGLNSRHAVNQSLFDEEERLFLENRVYEALEYTPEPLETKPSWIFGFRNNVMQLYRKPDGHLRFG
ncbi:unnamed protein product [Caenorhabditis bovis]|uniref:Uncharacterized protein n=1 Tax=Caenorhabditis bovis TaxID=2654633 RepID=A0A8S1EFT6_9PELO|nr:unnamed protein product [Caenorhabditis bovis]